jgi:hypothetical protein
MTNTRFDTAVKLTLAYLKHGAHEPEWLARRVGEHLKALDRVEETEAPAPTAPFPSDPAFREALRDLWNRASVIRTEAAVQGRGRIEAMAENLRDAVSALLGGSAAPSSNCITDAEVKAILTKCRELLYPGGVAVESTTATRDWWRRLGDLGRRAKSLEDRSFNAVVVGHPKAMERLGKVRTMVADAIAHVRPGADAHSTVGKLQGILGLLAAPL